jgi:hypothetical protein
MAADPTRRYLKMSGDLGYVPEHAIKAGEFSRPDACRLSHRSHRIEDCKFAKIEQIMSLSEMEGRNG